MKFSFKEMVSGLTGDPRIEEAEKLTKELISLREQRANVAMSMNDRDMRVSGDRAIIERVDKRMAEIVARLKELKYDVPADLDLPRKHN